MKTRFLTLLLCMGFLGANAQFVPFYHWTLLDQAKMDEIIGEASGETAYNHIMEMGGYTKARTSEEYKTTLFEAQYILDKFKEYGLEGTIERFPDSSQQWNGIRGELWEVSPGRKKLADYDDLRAMLVSGSQDADVEAELIWVNNGRKEDFANIDVKDKIVVTYSDPGSVSRWVQEFGAAGILSFSSPRPLVDPLQISWTGFWNQENKKVGFAFMMPPREGYLLRDRLLRNEKIRVHAVVRTSMEKTDLQVPTCVIRGTNPDAGEVIFSAHLFEGYLKQGGNDDLSGCAVILEVARMFKTMFDEGRLPRPERTMRFIFVPEFSGTIPWTIAHKDIIEKTLCNINLDMVGLWLSKSQSFCNLERTTFGNPHYVNDVVENYYRYIGETNRVMIAHWSELRNRIVAPSGSDEPFYYNIETHFGGSDHEVFNDWGVGVPGIMIITWPDLYYHTSNDLADKCDPTQLKRVSIITAASAYTIANADADMAGKIAAEVFSNAIRRMGNQTARALDELSKVKADNLTPVYKKVRGYIDATLINETETIESSLELAPGDAALQSSITVQTAQLKKIAEGQLAVIDQEMKSRAAKLSIAPSVLKSDDLEKRAIAMIPVPTARVRENGYEGYAKLWPEWTKGQGTAFYHTISDLYELQRLCNGKHNVLQIKQMLDTQSSRESDLQIMLDFISMLERGGLVILKAR
ncbi:MAG: M28 family peptidase [Bacteroidota bacterium]